MRKLIVSAAIIFSTHVSAASLETRADAFYQSIRESADEYNCAPKVCRTLAHKYGLTFNEHTFEVCDKGSCVAPRF